MKTAVIARHLLLSAARSMSPEAIRLATRSIATAKGLNATCSSSSTNQFLPPIGSQDDVAIAKVLQAFNGGTSCVQIYVNQHDFFISKDRVGEANSIELSQIWTYMADPDHPPPQSEPA